MCGIFGIVAGERFSGSVADLQATFESQFRHSNSRGSEASGWAVRTTAGIAVDKRPVSGVELVKESQFRAHFRESVGNGRLLSLPLAAIGHSRLVTNGRQAGHMNNQPAIDHGVVGVHNGIVVNADELVRAYMGDAESPELDTQALLAAISKRMAGRGMVRDAVKATYTAIKGSASLAALFDSTEVLLLATNTGSLYTYQNNRRSLMLFASERLILERVLRQLGLVPDIEDGSVQQLAAGWAAEVDLVSVGVQRFCLSDDSEPAIRSGDIVTTAKAKVPISVLSRSTQEWVASLQRCKKCILPETMPFVDFDQDGVCRFCREYVPQQLLGVDALREKLERHRSGADKPDCLVAFSGGRDSSFALHFLKEELGAKPVCFTYDWGMVTDLARRNQARMCGKLGIEHILISADIAKKRRYVRKNIEAWLRRPRLGMVPLFMAGDKQFYYHSNKLLRDMNLKIAMWAHNPLEETNFKTGFCGVAADRFFRMPVMKRFHLTAYYAKEYLFNPWYMNSSLLDSAGAYLSSFAISHAFDDLFQYIEWDEDEINSTLIGGYGWEVASDLTSTWRIGDGTAAFYNYIYYNVAGFTEFDTYHSNQIRAGKITRDRALELVEKQNETRWSSLIWYAQTIGFNLDEVLGIIDRIPKVTSAHM